MKQVSNKDSYPKQNLSKEGMTKLDKLLQQSEELMKENSSFMMDTNDEDSISPFEYDSGNMQNDSSSEDTSMSTFISDMTGNDPRTLNAINFHNNLDSSESFFSNSFEPEELYK